MPDSHSSSSVVRRHVRALVRFVAVMIVMAPLLGNSVAVRVAADEARCFDVPGITSCVEGSFLEFWNNNGGLATFGYPLGPARYEQTSDGSFLVQYFERARFELHATHAPPYDVMLGRLGAERLALLGGARPADQKEAMREECLYWAETQHNVCGAFRDLWLSRGLALDGPAASTAPQLALWGLPLTGIVPQTTADGIVLTQWFERARFEQQPNGQMTIGLLGREMLETAVAPVAPAAAVEVVPVTPAVQAPPVARVPNVPMPQLPCNSNVPIAAEGIQVWMADPRPAPGQDAVACVRLIVDGEAIRGAPAITYRYRGGERRASIAQSTGYDGVASFIFYTGDSGGSRVVVEALVTYRGVTYSAITEYVPQ